MNRTFFAAGVLACIFSGANAHEFWIDPEEHLVPVDGQIIAHLRVGEVYEGSSFSYIPQRFHRFQYAFGGETLPVSGTVGDRPALTLDAPGDGLVTLIHMTTDSNLTWDDFADFEAFVRHKDAEWALAEHEARGLSSEDVTEVYSRYAKSLVAVGSGAGTDIETGLLTEIVALENPFTDDVSDGVDVRLLFQRQPRGDEQIEIFEKAPSGEVEVSLVRTDADGIATIPVQPGHRYMLDAVVLRDGGTTAQWESLWANLTFAVPAN